MGSESESESQAIIEFLKHQVLHDPNIEIDEDTPLISSGLLDSFAIMDVLIELEKVTKGRIPSGRVSPRDFETVRQMILMARRVGS